jgi:hypothetical protein
MEPPELLLYSALQPPATYGSMPFEEKLNWQIANYYPQMIEWIARWVEVVDSRGHDLVTTFDQLHDRDENFVRELIGKLYGDNFRVDIRLPEKTMRGSHFRSGRRDEWQEVLSPEQIDRTTRMIPSPLRHRFNWPDVAPPNAEAFNQAGNASRTTQVFK